MPVSSGESIFVFLILTAVCKYADASSDVSRSFYFYSYFASFLGFDSLKGSQRQGEGGLYFCALMSADTMG